MTTPRPAAVLFDLDGTLVDTSALWQAAYVALADDLGVTLPENWWASVRGRSLSASLAVFGPPRAAGPMGGSSRWTAGTDLESVLLAQAGRRLGSIPVTWLPGARELLAAVDRTGIDVAVVTSTWAGSPRRSSQRTTSSCRRWSVATRSRSTTSARRSPDVA